MLVEEMSTFFNTSDFASDALLADVAVRGIFDREYLSDGAGLGMSSTQPAFTLATIDVPQRPSGKLLVRGDGTYRVVDHHPDGTGVSVLMLELTT